MAITVRSDLRSLFGLARDQGRRPTCAAFAVSDAHAVECGPYTPLSVEHLYFHGVQRAPNGHPSAGISLAAICKALQLDGQCAEAGWPYLASLPADLATWLPPPTATPVFRAGSNPLPPKTADIIARLAAGKPMVLTLLLGERFYSPNNGIVVVGPNDSNTDWHAVIAVGYGDDVAEDFLLIRNSWGENWGIEGHAWISTAYLEPRIHMLTQIG